MPKNSICAEIGVNRGNFSKSILKIVQPKKLYLIDPWKWPENQTEMDENYNKTLNRVKEEIKSGQVILKKRIFFRCIS